MTSKKCATDQIPKEDLPSTLQHAPAGIELSTIASDFASSLTEAEGLDHWKTQAKGDEELAKNLERRDKWGVKLLFVWRSIRQMSEEERKRFSGVFDKIEKIGSTCLDYQGFMNNYNEVIKMLKDIANKQGGRRRRGKTAKKGRKTRKTRRRGGVWPFTKKEEPPKTSNQLAEEEAEGAKGRLGVSTPLINPMVGKRLDEAEDQIRREHGNHSAYMFRQSAEDALKLGARRRSKKTQRRRR